MSRKVKPFSDQEAADFIARTGPSPRFTASDYLSGGNSESPSLRSLLDRLRDGSNPGVGDALMGLARELSEPGTDDSNTVAALRAAASLCAAVRELLLDRSKEEDKDAGRSDGPDVVTLELDRINGNVIAKAKRFDHLGGRLVTLPHQELVIRLDRGQIAFFRRRLKA